VTIITITRTKLTPPQIARMWGIKCHKVLAWIRSGELKAMNAAEKLGGRPRYLVDKSDLAAFEKGRQVIPTPLQSNRRKHKNDSCVTEYF